MNLHLYLIFIAMLLGIYGLAFSQNIVKSIIFMNVVQTALVMLFLKLSTATGTEIPIIESGKLPFIDPLPQALVITVIVIGAATTSLALIVTIKIFHYYGSLRWKDVFERTD